MRIPTEALAWPGRHRHPVRPLRLCNGLIDRAGHDGSDGGSGEDAGLAMLRRRTRRTDPEAALHILDHIVPDVPPEEDGDEE